MNTDDQGETTRARQRELYGAPLRDSVGRVTGTLDLSQAALARVLGMSAPMLSQLVSGRRTKIGNPVAVQRLQSLLDLAEEVDAGLSREQAAARVGQIGDDDTTSFTRRRALAPRDAPEVPEVLHRLLHAVASGREIVGAAELLAPDHPELAEVLRVYGTGTSEERAQHFGSVSDLL